MASIKKFSITVKKFAHRAPEQESFPWKTDVQLPSDRNCETHLGLGWGFKIHIQYFQYRDCDAFGNPPAKLWRGLAVELNSRHLHSQGLKDTVIEGDCNLPLSVVVTDSKGHK